MGTLPCRRELVPGTLSWGSCHRDRAIGTLAREPCHRVLATGFLPQNSSRRDLFAGFLLAGFSSQGPFRGVLVAGTVLSEPCHEARAIGTLSQGPCQRNLVALPQGVSQQSPCHEDLAGEHRLRVLVAGLLSQGGCDGGVVAGTLSRGRCRGDLVAGALFLEMLSRGCCYGEGRCHRGPCFCFNTHAKDSGVARAARGAAPTARGALRGLEVYPSRRAAGGHPRNLCLKNTK